jgi:hypothetical protein
MNIGDSVLIGGEGEPATIIAIDDCGRVTVRLAAETPLYVLSKDELGARSFNNDNLRWGE